MKSKSLVEKQMQRKSNSDLVGTIIAAKKNKSWFRVAEVLSGPRHKMLNKNLDDLETEASDKTILVVPGKILSDGEINKKIKVVALNFSEKAKEKLLKSGCEVESILEEIKKNPEGKGIKILE